jgi:hypothetical protein
MNGFIDNMYALKIDKNNFNLIKQEQYKCKKCFKSLIGLPNRIKTKNTDIIFYTKNLANKTFEMVLLMEKFEKFVKLEKKSSLEIYLFETYQEMDYFMNIFKHDRPKDTYHMYYPNQIYTLYMKDKEDFLHEYYHHLDHNSGRPFLKYQVMENEINAEFYSRSFLNIKPALMSFQSLIKFKSIAVNYIIDFIIENNINSKYNVNFKINYNISSDWCDFKTHTFNRRLFPALLSINHTSFLNKYYFSNNCCINLCENISNFIKEQVYTYLKANFCNEIKEYLLKNLDFDSKFYSERIDYSTLKYFINKNIICKEK